MPTDPVDAVAPGEMIATLLLADDVAKLPLIVPVPERVAVAANRCWFKSGDAAFKTYAFAPELTSFSDRPRILLTRKGSSDIRPLLVVQAEGKPARLSAFGPMMNEQIAGRVNADVKRWATAIADAPIRKPQSDF